MIEVINKIVRTSRQMLKRDRPEPTPEELAGKLGMPLEKVRRVLKIAKEPFVARNSGRRRGGLPPRRFHRGQNAILPIDASFSLTCGKPPPACWHH